MAEDKEDSPFEGNNSDENLLSSIMTEIFTSPLNIVLLGVCAVLLYKIFRSSNEKNKSISKLEFYLSIQLGSVPK